jgi:aarF domain-containing kinase
MKELFEWRLMQTDPNWGNFLYDLGTKQTTLIDFGATREYPKSFVDGYLRIVWANANRDEDALLELYHRMGFLTGEEDEIMLEAHKQSGFTVGEPFWKDEPFDFKGSQISTRMSEHISVFLKHPVSRKYSFGDIEKPSRFVEYRRCQQLTCFYSLSAAFYSPPPEEVST